MTAPPPSARIDLHSHLLPGVDDGCRTPEESLACVRALVEMGYAGGVCTPHAWPAQYPGQTPATVRPLVKKLQARIDDEGLPYRLWPGGEVRLFEDADRWMRQHGVPVLGGGDGGTPGTVLIDSWRGDWPAHHDRTIDWLLGEGHTPLLAHPERSPTRRGFPRLVRRLRRRGVLLQGNLRSLSGGEGERALDLARGFLRDGVYACLASDTHRPAGLADRSAGLAAAGERVGDAELHRLTAREPRRLLGLPVDTLTGPPS